MLPALQRVKPTIVLSVPLIIEKIYKSRIHPQLSKNVALRQLMKIPAIRKRLHRVAGRKLLDTFGGELHLFCIGGAALAPDVEFFLREARFPYAIGYGLTETSPLVAGTDPSHTRYRSTGKALPGIQIRIADPDPETDEGEIHIRGPVLMQGYYQDPARTADVFTDDGWFRTGDLGVLDEEGYLYIRGRSKNVILGPSGKNIYPEEIEAALAEFDIVQESLVFQQGRQLVARVFLDYERLSTEGLSEQRARERIVALLDGLRRDVNERLSSFSRLHRLIEQREPFEKTPTQKIKRHLYVTPEGT
jgi:long-chain acyl-CoA synthetase